MQVELEVGPPPPNIQLEEVGQWVLWVLELEPAPEGTPLLPLWVELMEVDGTKQAQEDGATVEEDAMGG